MANPSSTPRGKVLVVDDDKTSRDLMSKILASAGHTIVSAGDGKDALKLAGDSSIELVVSDIRMVEVDGLEVLKAFRGHDTPVILVTAFGNVDGAVDAIQRGAYDYISKPYDVDQIQIVVGRALHQRRLVAENRELRKKVRDKYALENIVGRSEAMLQVFKTAARVAATDATVLILGESGTGKELVARAIHNASPRASGPFVPVDCGAIAEGVLESELFGHARGAFTGASAARRGLFEEAKGGTLFLDEIGDIGAKLQSQLLRALQEGEIRPVGTNEVIHVDTRVVAATNKDLAQLVKDGKFREDLYYRLNVVTIRLPPLRERHEDIPLLCEHFGARYARSELATFSPEALDLLCRHGWPGNVRELENAIARAMALNPSGVIVAEDLPDGVRNAPARSASAMPADRPSLDELSRRYAQLVLKETGGNKTRAAEILAIDRKTLSRLVGGESGEQT
ncbi:MAG TPA: sigma-54 dependent transcriptional regulator [Myxococcales bacterium]|jgi:DNA-binding NtrC family response regulator